MAEDRWPRPAGGKVELMFQATAEKGSVSPRVFGEGLESEVLSGVLLETSWPSSRVQTPLSQGNPSS